MSALTRGMYTRFLFQEFCLVIFFTFLFAIPQGIAKFVTNYVLLNNEKYYQIGSLFRQKNFYKMILIFRGKIEGIRPSSTKVGE